MPRDLCPHYPSGSPDASGLSRCRACGQIMASSTTSAVPHTAEYPGAKAGASTQLSAAKNAVTNVLHGPR